MQWHDEIGQLIERSSMGTQAVRRLRRRTPGDVVANILSAIPPTPWESGDQLHMSSQSGSEDHFGRFIQSVQLRETCSKFHLAWRQPLSSPQGGFVHMAEATSITKVHVFVNRRKVELTANQLTGAGLLEKAGFEGQGWDLFKLQGEGDPTGGQLIQANEVLHLKEGERFRVIPGNRTFGA